MRRLASVLLVLTAIRMDAAARALGSASSDSLRVERLVALGKLWGAVD